MNIKQDEKIKMQIGQTYEMNQEESLKFFDTDADSLELLLSGKGYRGIIHCLSDSIIQSAIIHSDFQISNIDVWVEDEYKDCTDIIEIISDEEIREYVKRMKMAYTDDYANTIYRLKKENENYENRDMYSIYDISHSINQAISVNYSLNESLLGEYISFIKVYSFMNDLDEENQTSEEIIEGWKTFERYIERNGSDLCPGILVEGSLLIYSTFSETNVFIYDFVKDETYIQICSKVNKSIDLKDRKSYKAMIDGGWDVYHTFYPKKLNDPIILIDISDIDKYKKEIYSIYIKLDLFKKESNFIYKLKLYNEKNINIYDKKLIDNAKAFVYIKEYNDEIAIKCNERNWINYRIENPEKFKPSELINILYNS